MEMNQNQAPELAVANWPIERLIPYARNARLHSAEQIAQIAASIKEFGFNNPVLMGPDGDIIAGHGRALAARKLGLTEVPVIVLSHLSENQKRAFMLADNQLALNAGWDPEILRLELEALTEANFNLDLIGFSDEDLAKVLAREPSPRGSDPDAVPELQGKPVNRGGDLWVLGEHRLLCGDGTQLDDLARVLTGRPCDLVFTDLPYNVNYVGKAASRMKIVNDDLGREFEAFLQAACNAILAVAQGAIYICMSSSELHRLHRAYAAAGGHWSTYVMWIKNTFTLGRSDYQRQYEPILYGWRQEAGHHWCGDRNQGDAWFVDKPFRNELHPTMKPVELVERAIHNSSQTGNVVLDPFAGAGSTMIACENLERHARLVEIDPQYADVSVRRWQEYTGQRAYLDGDGKCFEEIEHERGGLANSPGSTR
ncbi:MAG TPA: site-specific DNA-methyltransferase [Bryobacteraceae bacterium]|jgi:DNA modification methylase